MKFACVQNFRYHFHTKNIACFPWLNVQWTWNPNTITIKYGSDRLRFHVSLGYLWGTLAEFTQKCDVSAWMLQNTSKSGIDKSTEQGRTEKTHCPKSPRRRISWTVQDILRPPCQVLKSYDCTFFPFFFGATLWKSTIIFNKFCGALRWADSTPCGPKRVVGGTSPRIIASLELNRSRTHKEDGHGIADVMKATPRRVHRFLRY